MTTMDRAERLKMDIFENFVEMAHFGQKWPFLTDLKIFPIEQVIYKENYGPYGPDFHQPNIWKCLSIILLCILFVHLYEQYQGK